MSNNVQRKRKRDPAEESAAEHRAYARDYMSMCLNPFEGTVVGYPDFDTSFTTKRRLMETHRVTVPHHATPNTYRGLLIGIEPDDDGLVSRFQTKRATDWNDVKDYYDGTVVHAESVHKSAQAGNIQRILALGAKIRVDPKTMKSCTIAAVPYFKDGENAVVTSGTTFEQFARLKGAQVKHFAAGEQATFECVCLPADYAAFSMMTQLEAASYSRIGWMVWILGLDAENSGATTYDGDGVTVELAWCIEEQAMLAMSSQGGTSATRGNYSEHALSIARTVLSTIGGAIGAFGQGALQAAGNTAVSVYNRVRPALTQAGSAAFQYALNGAFTAARNAYQYGSRAAPLLLEAA